MRGAFELAAGIAGAQHGRVTRRQLLAAGIDGKRVDRWLADGRLLRVHRGVYAVGHAAPSMHADYAAAVLACGAGATLSHAPAGRILTLLRAAGAPRRPRSRCQRPPDAYARGSSCTAWRRSTRSTSSRSTASASRARRARCSTSRSGCHRRCSRAPATRRG